MDGHVNHSACSVHDLVALGLPSWHVIGQWKTRIECSDFIDTLLILPFAFGLLPSSWAALLVLAIVSSQSC